MSPGDNNNITIDGGSRGPVENVTWLYTSNLVISNGSWLNVNVLTC